MPELTFQVRGAEAVRDVASPAIGLHIEISNSPPRQPVQTVLLNCQIQIEASRRRYAGREHDRLRDVFGEAERWGQTLRPLHWTNLTTTVPGFTGSTAMTLVIPCTFDLNVTPSKYFHAVEGDAVPVLLLFSGTIFYRTDANLLQAAPIPWNTEARFALPAALWKESIDLYHLNTAWIGLRRDVFERLYDYKVQRGLATLDEAVERMIENAVEVGA
jgi:hypothetical protein